MRCWAVNSRSWIGVHEQVEFGVCRTKFHMKIPTGTESFYRIAVRLAWLLLGEISGKAIGCDRIEQSVFIAK